jgi:hypothetical protein
MNEREACNEFVTQIELQANVLRREPSRDLIDKARAALDAAEAISEDLTGIQTARDNFMLLAAIGMIMSARAQVIEDQMYKEEK